MNWENLFEATNAVDKPVPGWLFKEICTDVEQYPEHVPDVAEHCMRSVLSHQRMVSLKGCLVVRHLAEEVFDFRAYMIRCDEALEHLARLARPPLLPQAQSLEREEDKIYRIAADRALRAVVSSTESFLEKESVRARCEGFGNYMPPIEAEEVPTGVAGLVNEMVGFVGDAVADTVDDFREKGAVGAVRDGIADAADLIFDSVNSVWGLLGGRKVREAQAASTPVKRICQPRPLGTRSTFKYISAEDKQDNLRPVPRVDSGSTEDGTGLAEVDAVDAAALLSLEEDCLRADSAELLSFDAEPLERRSALKLKEEGNSLVRCKKFQEAIQCYEAAIVALDIEGGTEQALLSALHANLALCHLQLESYRPAHDAATRSLELDPKNMKALYRRCLAHKGLEMWDEAQEDLAELILQGTPDAALTRLDMERLKMPQVPG